MKKKKCIFCALIDNKHQMFMAQFDDQIKPKHFSQFRFFYEVLITIRHRK